MFRLMQVHAAAKAVSAVTYLECVWNGYAFKTYPSLPKVFDHRKEMNCLDAGIDMTFDLGDFDDDNV